MKKTMALFWVIFVFAFTLASCSAADGIPDGTYSMTGIANSFGVGETFTVKSNIMTIPIYGIADVDYTYKISGKEIKLTAQGATLSYSYEKKGDSHVIGGVEYITSNNNSNDSSQTTSTQSTQSLADEPIADIAELIPSYEPLNLSVSMTEQTFVGNSIKITPEGNLVKAQGYDYGKNEEEIVDNDVRSLLNDSNVYGGSKLCFYIKNDNSLWGWGSNAYGALGDGTGVDQEKPVKILDNVAWIAQDSDSYSNIMHALKLDKTYWTWGDGKNYAPVLLAEDVVKPLTDGWFLNSGGFILNYKTGEQYIDEPVYDIQLFVEYQSLNAVYIDSNKNLQLRKEIGWTGEYEVTLIAENVEKIFADSKGTYVHFIKSDSSLWGYGANGNGQLGDGTKIPERNEAVKIADDVIDVTDYAFLKSNSELWSWDSNKPTPEKSLDNISVIGYYSNNLKYIVTTDNKVFYRQYFSNWAELADLEKIEELENVKIPQTVIFP